jgi:hypothetical protein
MARDLDLQPSAEPQSAGDLGFEDLDQPVKDSRAVPRSRRIQVGLDVRPAGPGQSTVCPTPPLLRPYPWVRVRAAAVGICPLTVTRKTPRPSQNVTRFSLVLERVRNSHADPAESSTLAAKQYYALAGVAQGHTSAAHERTIT